jgi:2-methylisocitrate lyase-like PEP mutase family enzyme
MNLSNPLPTPLDHSIGRPSSLRQALAGQEIVLAPGVFDCLSATLVERAGFGAAYITGSGISMSMLGAPDVGLASPSEIYERVRRICDCITIPVIVDADTGYGGPLNVLRTVREMELAGAAGIQLEDQEWPKKCGHEPGRVIAPTAVMLDRIAAAVDARRDANLLIIARTDARSASGIEAAVDRGLAFFEAGADCVFVESPESREELIYLNERLKGLTLVNLVEGGKTPLLNAQELGAMGFNIAIYPNALTRLFGKMGSLLLASLHETGETKAFHDRMLNHRELFDLFGYKDWIELERRLSANTLRHKKPNGAV